MFDSILDSIFDAIEGLTRAFSITSVTHCLRDKIHCFVFLIGNFLDKFFITIINLGFSYED